MAKGEVTGATKEEVEQLREDFAGTPASEDWDFEEAKCLTTIGKQPEEYDGPTRFCKRWTVHIDDEDRRAPACPFHGGDRGEGSRPDLLEPEKGANSVTHGFFASNENLINDFSDDEKDFYETVMYDWPEQYGIDFDEDPSAMEDMHALALEVITDSRVKGDIRERGVTVEKDVYDENGQYQGTEEIPHYLLPDSQKQRKLIMKMKKELGISRKHRDVMSAEEDKADALGGSLASLLSSDE